MVSRRSMFAFLCALALLLVFAGAAWAEGGVNVQQYDVQETVTVTVNALGDAHYLDVLKYDPSFFSNAGVDFTEYPTLLSRRFERQAAVKELQNFKSQFDRATSTVTLSYDKPGEVYNMGRYWLFGGFLQAPTKQSAGDQVFEYEATENNEFTLWQDLKFQTTTHLKLPAGTSSIRYDASQNAMLWNLPYAVPAAAKNVLQKNMVLFVVVFVLLIAASMVMATVTLVRTRPVLAYATAATRVPLEPAAAPTLTAAAPTLPAAAPTLPASSTAEAPPVVAPVTFAAPTIEEAQIVEEPVAPVIVEAAVAPVLEQSPAPQAQPHFCTHCGASVASDERFCTGCGGAIE
jgi:hypothetical protein